MARPGMHLPAALLGLAAGLWLPWATAAERKFHYDCRVTETGEFSRSKSVPAELSHFRCSITGGLLHGFVATGTNILERRPGGGRLVAAIVVAQNKDSALVYEVGEGTRRLNTHKGRVIGWESTGSGVYRWATGSAAPLAGKSFTSTVRSRSPRAFTIDVVVRD